MNYILEQASIRPNLFPEHYTFTTLQALEGNASTLGKLGEIIGSLVEDFFPVIGGTL